MSALSDNTAVTNLELLDRIKTLEKRLNRLEKNLNYGSSSLQDEQIETEQIFIKQDESQDIELESSIGQYGLAWMGNIVLFVGITFLVQYLQNIGLSILSSVFGFISVGGIFAFAHYLRNSNSYMASIFNLNAYLLLFFVTLKLHFFSPNPLVENQTISLVLLLLVCGIELYLAIKKNYKVLAGLSLILLGTTSIFSDSTHFMLPIAIIISAIGIYFLFKFKWINLIYLSIFIAYLIYLIWFLSNPFMGHSLEALKVHQNGYIYLFIIGAIFSLIPLVRKSEKYSDDGIVGAMITNGLGFSFLLGLFMLSFFKDNYAGLTGSVAAFCLIYSVLLQVRSEWKISAALYALYGFVMLSVTLYGIYTFPRAYFLLSIQSLLVVSMAIWFRSKFIVVMNSFLYLVLLVVYLSTSPVLNGVNASFALVALITARILNWKKERLTIKTEMIRNFYLIAGFFTVLYTLYHFIANQYVTLSWTIAAVIYFILSFLLKNVKYRYMALGTMIAAALFLFIVDLSRIELVFRVIALLFLAVISIGLSFYYTKKLKKKVE